MSTFKGVVAEFPQVRIDFFRPRPGAPPPLACFLSHVHADHLTGLESLKAPFIYCSPATREILLRLEKYPHRMNFAKGILESRRQTYKHLKYLLKTLPLETPTVVELSPGNELRVTLFDANHCAGAVMFLIQGDGRAILYTGDIRSESWWVNSLVQNPVLIPYTLGSRRLDCLYLDTTFATKSLPYRDFQSKAEGVKELLEKVENYPPETVFYFHSWTFGYENVWIALSNFLESPIHLDGYRWSIYRSLSAVKGTPECREAPPLSGFSLGNHKRSGCLTSDPNVRLHSCEKGFLCSAVEKNQNVVHILPIVTRLEDGSEIAEVGVGGGKGDLDQAHELETSNTNDVGQLMHLCATIINDSDLRSRVIKLLSTAITDSKDRIKLNPHTTEDSACEDSALLNDLPLKDFIPILVRGAASHVSSTPPSSKLENGLPIQEGALPKTIKFPYSRHSSYKELCELVKAFRPRDVYPCTVDSANWNPKLSMRSLFGHLCSANVFAHDAEMLALIEEREERLRSAKRVSGANEETQKSTNTESQATTVEESQRSVEREGLSKHSAFISSPNLKRKAHALLEPKPSFNTSEIEGTKIGTPTKTNIKSSRTSHQTSVRKRISLQVMDNFRQPSSSPSRLSSGPATQNKNPKVRLRVDENRGIYVESIHSSQESDDGHNSQMWTDQQRDLISAYFAERDRKAKEATSAREAGGNGNPKEVLSSTKVIEDSGSDSKERHIIDKPRRTASKPSPSISTTVETIHSTPSHTLLASGIPETEPKISTTVETLRSTTREAPTPIKTSFRTTTTAKAFSTPNPAPIPRPKRSATPYPPRPAANRTPTPETQIRIPATEPAAQSEIDDNNNDDDADDSTSDSATPSSRYSTPELSSKTRQWAYDMALGRNGMSWAAEGGLVCTRKVEVEEEL